MVDDLASLQQSVAEAERLCASGHFPLALERYRSTVFKRLTQVISRDSFWWAADAVVIERLADLAILDGSLSAAQNLLTGLRDLYLREENQFAADYVRIKLSHLALESDDVTGAHIRLREMKSTIGDLESIDLSAHGLNKWETGLNWPGQDKDSKCALLARLYLVMGGILASYGQFHDAIQCLERGESLACSSQVPSVSQVCAPLRVSLAAACFALGIFTNCQDWLLRAKSAQPLESPVLQIRAHELLARLALMKGHYGEALNAFEKVLKQCAQLGFARPMAVASLNTAHLLILLNQTRQGLEHISNAELAAADDSSLRVRARVLRALAYARRESLADQVAISPSVSEMMRGSVPSASARGNHRHATADPLELPRSADFLSFFEDRALAVQWRLGKERFAEASELMGSLQSTFLSCDSPLIHARMKALQGMVEYYQSADSEAGRLLSEAANELQVLGLLPEAWQSKRVLSWCLSRLGRPSQEIARLDAEVQADLERLALSLHKVDRSSFLINKWTAAEEYFLGEINMLVAVERRARSQPWWRRPITKFAVMKRLNLLLANIDRHKLDSSSRFLGISSEEEAISIGNVPALWRRLLFHPLHTATIHFLVLPDRVLLVLHGWLRLGFGVSAITRGDLRDLVSAWYRVADKFDATRDLGVDSKKEANQELNRTQEQTLDHLGDALQLRALLDALPRHIKALRIAPDDSLLGFPFSVLRYQEAPIPERFSVSIMLPHAAEVIVPRQRVKNALLVGVSQGGEGVAPLPQVKPELDAVQAWSLKRGYKVVRLMDTAADKTSVIEGLKQSNLLHIACHGVFRTDKPGKTGFVLVPEGKHAEILSLIELALLDLRALEHATLSSCWAADRFILPGRQTIGLPETLLRCGTRSVLACLWPVDDLVAASFTERFYKYLERYHRDEALRRTQQDCIHGQLQHTRDSGLDTSSPIYWAGFNLYGSNTSL
jgi:CHAT domain-containing protein/tetratricopeptide (TPR) repeat protein